MNIEIPTTVPNLGTWEITRGSVEPFSWYPAPLPDGTIEDLSSYGSFVGQIRSDDTSSSTLLCTLTVTAAAPTQSDTDSVRLGLTARWKFSVTCPSSESKSTVTAIDTAENKGVFCFKGTAGAVERTFGQGLVVFIADRYH